MKRFLAVVLLSTLVIASIVADTSAYYPVKLDVVTVYSHADGYRVLYRRGYADFADMYLPAKWFISGGKGELVRGNDQSYPYIILYYKDGKFDHLRLYVKDDSHDPMWRVLPPDQGVGKFKDEDPKLQF